MRLRQYRLRDDDNMACPLCQSIVGTVNMSTHKKPESASSFGMDHLQATIYIPYRLSGSSTVLTLSQGS